MREITLSKMGGRTISDSHCLNLPSGELYFSHGFLIGCSFRSKNYSNSEYEGYSRATSRHLNHWLGPKDLRIPLEDMALDLVVQQILRGES